MSRRTSYKSFSNPYDDEVLRLLQNAAMHHLDLDVVKLIVLYRMKSKHLLSVNPILLALVEGVCNNGSRLSAFAGIPHILQYIWELVTLEWTKMIKVGVRLKSWDAIESDSEFDSDSDSEFDGGSIIEVAYHEFDSPPKLRFPKPNDIYVNMMPFVMESTFEKCKLPDYLKPYWDKVINKHYLLGYKFCKLIPKSEYGKIGFLTIHESYVPDTHSQRRGGVHTDCPGKIMIAPNRNGELISMGRVTEEEEEAAYNILESSLGDGFCVEQIKPCSRTWGYGVSIYDRELNGGMYMASNIGDSCRVWNCRILPDKNGEEIIGDMGDIEHLREFLPESETMKPNKMYWITDRTPHESLPLKSGCYRQYFRLVTSQVSVWFEEHSTKNPLGVMPDPRVTQIVKGSKFNKNWSLLLDENKLESSSLKKKVDSSGK